MNEDARICLMFTQTTQNTFAIFFFCVFRLSWVTAGFLYLVISFLFSILFSEGKGGNKEMMRQGI